MRQFDIYTNSDMTTNKAVPYFLVLQCELFRSLNTRIVVPLVFKNSIKQIEYINPIIKIKDNSYIALFNKIGHLPISELQDLVDNVEKERNELQIAYDFMFQCS